MPPLTHQNEYKKNIFYKFARWICAMHSSAKRPSPPLSVLFCCSCDKVYYKQGVSFLLYLLGQIVT